MTFRGNTKQRVSLYGSAASFVISILCAIEAMTGGDGVYLALAAFLAVLGVICAAGVWACGLTRSDDAEEQEWADSIR